MSLLAISDPPAVAQLSLASHVAESVFIPRETDGVRELKDASLLVLCDVENLSFSARRLGFGIDYRGLASQLRAVSKWCSAHAFFSRRPGCPERVNYFESCGWIPHPQDIQVVYTHQGKRVRANSDNAILFCTGVLASRLRCDTVLIASGDGDLTTDLSRLLSEFHTPRRILTLSVVGSSSERIKKGRNPLISGNLHLGLDLLGGKLQPATI